ncbi:hypothetical protein FHL15_011389 [Xylaria flabelliformis]|uniref:Uncharacterized protein n=1 Tax=Xylaria flabelliformis TaxID=2512241 RepID=A0A553HIE3_9PEZI|nr:hypothetical protein FHL15_011389 [Xylaria flabelliformis]
MASEDWKSNEKVECYVRLAGNLDGLVKLRWFQYQRPWHSKIRLPIEEDRFEGPEFYHFECHDLDCLIVVLRMLMSLDFTPKPEYATAAVMTCATHHFGMDRPADYQVKGMLAQKLFPELKNPNITNSINDVLPKMTFENLLKHPGIDKVIFGSPYFLLQHPQLIVINPALLTHIESVRDISSVDDMIVNQVNWDGCRELSEVASEQASYLNLAAENGTKVHRRFCAVPLLVRVMFTPDKDHPRSFGDVQRFTLRAPMTKRLPNKVVEVLSDSTYLLRAVVKMDPKNPIENPAEVRLYDVNAVMMLGDPRCNDVYRPVAEHKLRPDSGWKLGDPNFKFMLFYNVWEGEKYPTPLVTPIEYRSPDPIRSYEVPERNKVEESEEDSERDDLTIATTRATNNERQWNVIILAIEVLVVSRIADEILMGFVAMTVIPIIIRVVVANVSRIMSAAVVTALEDLEIVAEKKAVVVVGEEDLKVFTEAEAIVAGVLSSCRQRNGKIVV